MKCKNCNTKLQTGAKLCPNCGTEAEASKNIHNIRRIWITIITIVGVLLVLTALSVYAITRGNTGSSREPEKLIAANPTPTAVPPIETITIITPTPPVTTPVVTSPPPTPSDETPSVIHLSEPLPNMFYVKNNTVYYISGKVLKPKEITAYPYDTQDQFYVRVSKDGKKMFYPKNVDFSKEDFCADLMYCNLASKNSESIKIDSEVNNFTLNQEGSKIYYLKNKDLYVSDLSKSEKIAANVNEFYINKKGDTIVYRTSDTGLYQYSKHKKVKELDTDVYLQYVSEDLNTIYYFKKDCLYLLKDGNDIQLIASGIKAVTGTIIYIYEDGSLYYRKPNTVTKSDLVNDDMAAKDAAMKEPIKSNYTDQNSYAKAIKKYQDKINRDDIRRLIKQETTVREMNSLYYYSNGKSTKVSDYCTKVWMYNDDKTQKRFLYRGNEKPILAYSQYKLDKINMSKVTTYADIFDFTQKEPDTETYLCDGPRVLKKFENREIYQVVYDIEHDKLYYILDFHEQSNRGDLYYVIIDGSDSSEGKEYVKDFIMYDPYSIVIGDSTIYLKNGNSVKDDFVLYVNNVKIDTRVIGWIYRIKNSKSFLYLTQERNNSDPSIHTLHLFKDGKSIKIADQVSSYYIFDENHIAYVTRNSNTVKKLYLYDGTDTRKLIDQFSSDLVMISDFITPLENEYYSYFRPTVILP